MNIRAGNFDFHSAIGKESELTRAQLPYSVIVVLMLDCEVFHYCELVFSFTEELFVSGMTDRVGMEDTECVQAFSLRDFKHTETQFRSGLMVPAGNDGKDGTSTKTDQDNYHRQQVSSSDYGGVHGNKERSAMQEHQWEGSREVRGVQEETDYATNEDDEKEQYKFLYMADKSGMGVAGSQVASNTGGQKYQLPPQERKEFVEDTPEVESKLEKALRDKEEELKEKIRDNNTLREEVHKFLDKFNEAKDEVDMKNREISELGDKVGTLQERLGKKEEELEYKEMENNQLREDVQAAKKGGTTPRGRSSMDEKMHIKLNQTMGRCKDLEKVGLGVREGRWEECGFVLVESG